jgi:hypothetical protein
MTVNTSELDASVARLLGLAEKIERGDVAGPFQSTVPADPPPFVVPEPEPVASAPVASAPVAKELESFEPTAPAPARVDEVFATTDLATEDPATEHLAAEDPSAEHLTVEDVASASAVAEPEHVVAPADAVHTQEAVHTQDAVHVADDVQAATAPVWTDAADDVLDDDDEVDDEPIDPLSVLVVPTNAAEVDEPPAGPEVYLARLEQVRAEIGDLAARRRRPRGRRRLEDAKREERELLDKLGYDSYLDLMLANAGTRQSESSTPSSGRENGERDGSGGGGGSSDIGRGGSGVTSSLEPPPPPPSIWAPAPAASDDPWADVVPPAGADHEEGDDEEGEAAGIEVVADSGEEPAAPNPFESGAPTIADWLASPLAPPSAASPSVDVGA